MKKAFAWALLATPFIGASIAIGLAMTWVDGLTFALAMANIAGMIWAVKVLSE